MFGSTPFISFTQEGWAGMTGNTKKAEDLREQRLPVEIWEQFITERDPELDCSNLKEKIAFVKKRIKVLEENTKEMPVDEYEVLGYLNARLNYEKHKDFFKWPVTNEEIINSLCSKFKVKVVPVEQFYTTIPEEGIDEIVSYRNACQKIRKEKPVFRLIVPDVQTGETQKKKRDPILIASSPFGRWDYILGAWDKEVAIVDDFIYNGK